MDLSFYLTRQEPGKLTSVYAHIRYHKVKFKYYLSEKIDPEFWNPKEQRAKKTNRFPGNMEFNRRLGKVYDKIKDLYSAYRNNNEGQDPTPEQFKLLIDQELNGRTKQPVKSLVAFLEELKETASNGSRVQPKTGKPYSKASISTYHSSLVHLKAFEQARRRKLQFEDITVEFHADYTEFLIKEFKLKPNSIGGDITNIKMLMNEALERGLHQNYQYKSRRFSITKEDTDSIYLNQSEIMALLDIDLSDSPKDERIRDMFVAGCYTGLRHSDLSAVRPEQIQDGYITITQIKTGHEVVIPVHPIVSSILDKYDGNFPKPVTNQFANHCLKHIGRKCKPLEVQLSKTYTKAGSKITRTFKKWELLTTHTARRSFATNEYLAGTSTETIMACTGHKSSAAFVKYLRLTPTEHAQKMKDIWATRNQMKAV